MLDFNKKILFFYKIYEDLCITYVCKKINSDSE